MSWKHNKRVVEDVPSWIGWDRMLGYYNQSPTDEHRKIFCALFETGGRVSEVIQLKPENFLVSFDGVKIQKMPVLKYREKKRRDFIIKRDEQDPLCEDLISFVEACEDEYLFPRRSPLKGVPIPGKHASRTWMYLKVREISDDLWPHWFRSMRASFNVFVREMDIYGLKKWFMWKKIDTPAYYIQQTLEEMAEDLGVTDLDFKPIVEVEPTRKPTPTTEPDEEDSSKEEDAYQLLEKAKEVERREREGRK